MSSPGTQSDSIVDEGIDNDAPFETALRAPLAASRISVLELKHQCARIRVAILICFGVGWAILSAALFVSWVTGTHPTLLTVDPVTALEGAHFYYGAVSTLGILAWGGAAAICFFGARFLSGHAKARRAARFLFWSGFLSLLLTLDDALLLHERLFPYGLYIPEKIVLLGYMIFFVVYAKSYATEILASDYLLLVAALSLLGGSVVIDQLLPRFELRTFIEDSFKFVGIMFWLAYFAHATRSVMCSALEQGGVHEAASAS